MRERSEGSDGYYYTIYQDDIRIGLPLILEFHFGEGTHYENGSVVIDEDYELEELQEIANNHHVLWLNGILH